MAKTTKKGKPPVLKRKSRLPIQLIGIILIAVGALFLINPSPENIKISFTLVLIGLFSVVLLTGKTASHRNVKKQSKRKTKKKAEKTRCFEKIKNIHLQVSEKLTVIIAVWIVFLFVMTRNVDMETFFVAIFIGILVIKELSDEFTTKYQKYELNIFIFAFLLVFVLIIGKKIISISSI